MRPRQPGVARGCPECVDGVASTEVASGLCAGGCACEWNIAQGRSAFAGTVMGRIAARNALKEA